MCNKLLSISSLPSVDTLCSKKIYGVRICDVVLAGVADALTTLVLRWRWLARYHIAHAPIKNYVFEILGLRLSLHLLLPYDIFGLRCAHGEFRCNGLIYRFNFT